MQRDLEALRTGTFDVLVLGGGMQGAWVALRAVEAGYRVALVERDDFGGATSANSLKILHGGLRYLQHVDLARMRESIRARREFCRRFPHLVEPLRCVMPLEQFGIRSPWILGPALLANDLISADRNSEVPADQRLGRGRLLGGRACSDLLSSLVDVTPFAGGLWWDALALDTARLCLEPVMLAAATGAVVGNRIEAVAYRLHNGRIAGAVVRDRIGSGEFEIASRVVVNACGPWAGHLSALGGLPTAFMPPAWVGGLNVVLRRSLGSETAVALSSVSKAADASAILRRGTRELFFVPWRSGTMVGTDYHVLSDPQDGHDGPPAVAVDGFVTEISRVAPRLQIGPHDVAAVHWGVLPMDSRSASLPSKSPTLAAGARETGAAGLIVVVGEKLTSAPVLSLRVLERVARELREANVPRLPRGALPLRSVGGVQPAAIDESVSAVTVARLKQRYGPAWRAVAAHGQLRPELLEPVHPGSSLWGVEVVHGLREEMALSLEDLVYRRLGADESIPLSHDELIAVARVAAREAGWDDVETRRQLDAVARYANKWVAAWHAAG